jgi:hypothetical protein
MIRPLKTIASPQTSARLRPRALAGITLLATLGWLATSPLGAASARANPDLTKGETNAVDRTQTWSLGPTGLRGWIYTRPAAYLDSVQGRITTASRQILVTDVGPSTPAEGVLQVGDVILGVGGKLFTDDARRSFGQAITEAEKEANGGLLKLVRFRGGNTENVELKLKVMGSYSDTAPYNCPKSRRVLEAACQRLVQEPLENNWSGAINGLALLAAGNPDYLPRVREFARRVAPPTLQLELKDGMVVWDWGYRNLFLGEYYLLTGDKEVLHAIEQYTVALAKGQSLYGTFGHGISMRTPDGQLHGSIPPYGPVNAAGLIGNLAIVLGQKCGVQDPEIAPAIDRASKFFGYYVDKGSIPYGEHAPWPYHENNGKNSMTALLFALQGDRIAQTRFFAQMATAGYANREYGHTGQGFSYLWGALGANAGGPDAAAAFIKEAAWHLDLERRSDGSFTYDGGEQYGPGEKNKAENRYFGDANYSGLSPNATYVLTYALPLQKLCITGRDARRANWLSQREVQAAIAAGRFDLDRKQLTPQQLVAAFTDWSPVVRGWAAEELAKRPEARALVPQLLGLAEGPEAHARQGACEALGYLKDPQALPVLVRLLNHPDRWLRFKAAEALKKFGDAARPVLPDMLAAVVNTAEPLQPVAWDDPIQIAQGQLAEALFHGLLRDSIAGVDKKLMYPAIQAVSRNPDGMARMHLKDTLEKQLSLEDVQALAPDILAAVQTPCPADTMFGNEIRMGAFKALTRYHFQEGIAVGVVFAKTQGGHGSENRTGEIMKEIVSYGAAARVALPGLNELIAQFNEQCRKGEYPAGQLNNRRVNAVKDAIKTIETATGQPEVRRIAPGEAKAGPRD